MTVLTPLPDSSLFHEYPSAWLDQTRSIRDDLFQFISCLLITYDDPKDCLDSFEKLVEFYGPDDDVERDGTFAENRVYLTDDGDLRLERFAAHDGHGERLFHATSITYHSAENTWWHSNRPLPSVEGWEQTLNQNLARRIVATFSLAQPRVQSSQAPLRTPELDRAAGATDEHAAAKFHHRSAITDALLNLVAPC